MSESTAKPGDLLRQKATALLALADKADAGEIVFSVHDPIDVTEGVIDYGHVRQISSGVSLLLISVAPTFLAAKLASLSVSSCLHYAPQKQDGE